MIAEEKDTLVNNPQLKDLRWIVPLTEDGLEDMMRCAKRFTGPFLCLNPQKAASNLKMPQEQPQQQQIHRVIPPLVQFCYF